LRAARTLFRLSEGRERTEFGMAIDGTLEFAPAAPFA
jgi:hypothetical protein